MSQDTTKRINLASGLKILFMQKKFQFSELGNTQNCIVGGKYSNQGLIGLYLTTFLELDDQFLSICKLASLV